MLVCLPVFKTGATPKSVGWVRFLHIPDSLGPRANLSPSALQGWLVSSARAPGFTAFGGNYRNYINFDNFLLKHLY